MGTEFNVIQPNVDGGGIDPIFDLLFLLSASEAGLNKEDAEGSIIELFKDEENRIAFDIDDNEDWWWLRTPYASYSYNARYVSTSGTLNHGYAYSGSGGLRPACNLSSDHPVSKFHD
jgi:hypothetical protein